MKVNRQIKQQITIPKYEVQREATKIYLFLNPFEAPWKRDPETGLINGKLVSDKDEQQWFQMIRLWERKAKKSKIT